jgi:ribosomal protein L21
MALDPKSAAKLGKAYGEGITDAVFGIVDDVRSAKNIKAANNQKIINQNKITEINNQIVRQNNALRVQAMQEIAAEQEAMAMARMTPAQRAAYKQSKIDSEKARARAERQRQESHDEMVQYFWAALILFVFLPLVVWLGLLIWGIADHMAYYSLKSWVPLLKVIVGR